MIFRPVKFAGKVGAGLLRGKDLTPWGAGCGEELAEFAESFSGKPIFVNESRGTPRWNKPAGPVRSDGRYGSWPPLLPVDWRDAHAESMRSPV